MGHKSCDWLDFFKFFSQFLFFLFLMWAQNLLAQSSKEFMIDKLKNYMISFSCLENIFEIKGEHKVC